MKKIIYTVCASIFSLLLISCSDDFLEKEPHYLLNENNAITDFDKAKAAIGGIYTTFQNDSWSGSLYLSLASKSGFVNWNQSEYNMDYTQTSPSNSGTSVWGAFYKSFNSTNFAVNGISKLPLESVPSEKAKTELVAEARALRAWVAINILWNYGHWWADDSSEYGILYRDEVVDLSNVEQARLTVGESYNTIFEDLDYAIANLPGFTTPRYMSKEFAKVLKAKALLYRGGYNNDTAALTEALALVNDVLNNKPGNLLMDPDLERMYLDSWDSLENLFVKYLEDNSSRSSAGGHQYTYALVYNGDVLPLRPGAELTGGLSFGLDWFKADPRWDIVTGEVRAPETWDETYRWTWKKLARLGRFGGQQATPRDEKYATYYFRLPELYIMKAELLARTGSSVMDAIAPINEMRSQRTSPVLSTLSPASHDELMNTIFKEYFLELFLENGSEFFAATRFKNNGVRWIETTKEGRPFVENTLCWPIPDAEMINNALMTQNPGLE